jgi:hypothetical protein
MKSFATIVALPSLASLGASSATPCAPRTSQRLLINQYLSQFHSAVCSIYTHIELQSSQSTWCNRKRKDKRKRKGEKKTHSSVGDRRRRSHALAELFPAGVCSFVAVANVGISLRHHHGHSIFLPIQSASLRLFVLASFVCSEYFGDWPVRSQCLQAQYICPHVALG